MKTFILSLFIFFQAFNASSQSFGASALDVKGNFDATVPVYRQWLRLDERPDVTIKYEQNAQGLEDALQLVERLLVKNELNMARPDVYKSLGGDINSDKPAALSKAIQEGKARINMAWYAPDGATLHLFLGEYSYEVNVLRAYKLE